jgi:uroporphyrin-III C-methyltransferase
MLARPRQTVVIYMGVATLPTIARQLVAHGLPADTPAAVVERASRDDQRTIAATIATLPQRAAEAGVKSPALVVIGEVVALHEVLASPALAAG